MQRPEFEKQREVLYREILKTLNSISNHPVIQLQNGPRDACLSLVTLYKQYNNLVDDYVK